MHIQINLEAAEGITSQLSHMLQHMEQIATDYRSTSLEIHPDVRKNTVEHMLREVERNIQQLMSNTSAYGNTLCQALQAYRQSEKTVSQLYHKLQEEHKHKSCLTDNIINVHTIKPQTIKPRNMRYPCPLPKKYQFEKAEIYAGCIQNGNNILVRSWRNKHNR